jgi:hypothetical protein
MPYKFTFKVDEDNHEFSCIIHSEQCESVKPNGIRCKNKTIIGTPYCHVHLKYKLHLTIKQSLIPNAGKGLFAIDTKKAPNAIIFKKNEKIIEYCGQLITDEDKNDRYLENTAPYTVKIKRDLNVDCGCKRGVGALANTRPHFNNSTLSVFRNKAFIKATRNIKNNEEIYLAYGRSYKINEEGVRHETKYIRNNEL